MIDEITIKEIESLLPNISRKIEIKGLIGKGGQKHVYKAIDLDTGENLVFKVLKVKGNILERLKREVRAVDIIDSNHIPKIFESNVNIVSEAESLIWLVEEFIDGDSLRTILQSGRTFSLSEVVEFINVMFLILEKAEKHNIVHRDIKPENIMIDVQGEYWLIDFGISRHLDLESITITHAPFGLFTIGYSAAEQFRNRKKQIDIRADLFSLGVVATEMIQGYNPYLHKASDILQVIKRIEQKPLPALRIDGDDRFLMAKFIKILGDNRLSRRPKTIRDAIKIFDIVKSTLNI